MTAKTQSAQSGEERGGKEKPAEIESRDYFHVAPPTVFEVFKNERGARTVEEIAHRSTAI
jgi:hypothetical protein